MKKVTLILITILFANLVFGQTTTENKSIDTKAQASISAADHNPQVFVVIDSKKYEVDDFDQSGIKLKWIKGVSILKEDLSLKINDRKKGAIFMYPKEKYEKRILMKLEKKKRS